MRAIEELRGMRGNYATYEDLVVRCCDLADEIERDVEERYIEGPTDRNGDPITFDTMIEQWGALDYIGCKMDRDGTCEWFVRGHDLSAPVLSANEVTIAKPPTVEDVLNELCTKAFHSREIGANVSYKDVIAEYAAKLQLKEEQ